MESKTFSKRAFITLTLLGIINIFSVSAHHAEHHPSESSHLLSHILIGLAVLVTFVGIYAIYNRKKLKSYFNKYSGGL